MAARRPFWKWHRWKSIGFCLWPPSTCIWNLKLKFQSKLDLCSGNHVVYRQTDRRTDGRTRWIQYTPPPTSLGGGINIPIKRKFLCHFIFGFKIVQKGAGEIQAKYNFKNFPSTLLIFRWVWKISSNWITSQQPAKAYNTNKFEKKDS